MDYKQFQKYLIDGVLEIDNVNVSPLPFGYSNIGSPYSGILSKVVEENTEEIKVTEEEPKILDENGWRK